MSQFFFASMMIVFLQKLGGKKQVKKGEVKMEDTNGKRKIRRNWMKRKRKKEREKK